MVDVSKIGAVDEYTQRARPSIGVGAQFKYFERFYRLPKKEEWDALMILGVRMNHLLSNQDIVNSFPWNGWSKKARSIIQMLILEVNATLEQPQSRTNEYTEIQCGVTSVDSGRTNMIDLATEGVLGFFWLTNWYFANLADDGSQNKLEVWNGAALLDMNNYLYGTVHNRHVGTVWNSPKKYSYPYGIPLKRPLVFYHFTNNYSTDQHSAYALVQVVAKVRFFASEKSLKHGE